MAVDSQGHDLTLSDGSWSKPKTFDPNGDDESISCPSVTFCAAVDLSGDALIYNGLSWSRDDIDPIRNPDSEAPTYPNLSISCPAAGFCLAGDDFGEYFIYRMHSWSRSKSIPGEQTWITGKSRVLRVQPSQKL